MGGDLSLVVLKIRPFVFLPFIQKLVALLSIVVFPKVDGIKFCLKQFCLLKSA